jgi:hypothetical protein
MSHDQLFSKDHFFGGAHLTDGTLARALNLGPVMHFMVGDITKQVVAPVPGTPTPSAMSVFGQIGWSKHRRILCFHIHLIENGTLGDLTVEWYRLRNFQTTKDWKLLGSATLSSAAGDYATATLIPTGEDALIEPWDYLFAQATDLSSIIPPGNGNGLTLDVHLAAE